MNSQDQNRAITSLFFEGRAYFDKSGGNTYHSVRIWLNGEIVAVVPSTYGYENAYQVSAISKLVELGYLPSKFYIGGIEIKTSSRPIWKVAKALDIDIYSVLTYGKKSELWKAGN